MTDIIQAVLLLALLALLSVGLLFVAPVTTDTLLETRDISVVGALILGVFGFVSLFADPSRYQVTFAGKSVAAVRQGMLWTILPLLLTSAGIYLIGNVIYDLDPTLESAAVFPVALSEYAPAALVPYGFFVFFVAIMSTADSFLYALASQLAQTFMSGPLSRPILRRMIVVIAAIVVVLALFFRDVVDIAVLAGAVLLATAVPMLYLIGGGRSSNRFVVLLAGGMLGLFFGLVLVGLKPDAGALVVAGFVVAALLPADRLVRALA